MRYVTFCIAAALHVGAAQAAEPPVEVRVDHLAPQVAERIKAYAARGKSALIRYLNGTRMIHNIRFEEVIRKD